MEYLKFLFSKGQKGYTILFTSLGLFFYVTIFKSIFSGELAYLYGGNALIVTIITIVLLTYYLGTYVHWKRNVKSK